MRLPILSVKMISPVTELPVTPARRNHCCKVPVTFPLLDPLYVPDMVVPATVSWAE